MAYTPVELRHVQFPRSLFRGYSRRAVDELLPDVVTSFEDVWRERADLADRAEMLEKELDDLRRRTTRHGRSCEARRRTASGYSRRHGGSRRCSGRRSGWCRRQPPWIPAR